MSAHQVRSSEWNGFTGELRSDVFQECFSRMIEFKAVDRNDWDLVVTASGV